LLADRFVEIQRAEDETRRQKEILQKIFDHVPVMINFIDEAGRIQLVNPEWERTLGWTLQEIKEQDLDIFALCYPDLKYRQEVLKFAAESNGEWQDFKPQLKDGRIIDTSWAIVHLSDGTSIGIGKDVGERKRAEEALRASEARWRSIFESSGVGIALTDPQGTFTATNRCYQELVGYTDEELRSMSYLDLTHDEDRPTNIALADDLWSGKLQQIQYEKRYRRKDGKLIWVRNTVSLPSGPETMPRFAMAVVEDITARKAAEDQLNLSVTQLRALAARLQTVREEERTHIARELHDEIGQVLTAIRLSLERANPAGGAAANDAQTIELTNELIGRVRELSLELRPAMLDDLGLLPALIWHLKRYGAQGRLAVDFKQSGLEERRFAPAIETAAYRIVQEALTNVVRHAGVDRVRVEVHANQETLCIRVQDAGKGFDPVSLSAVAAIGLSCMRERALMLGGQLRMISSPGQGAILLAELPLDPDCPSEPVAGDHVD
jgi:PAS domain S-box-containing protein